MRKVWLLASALLAFLNFVKSQEVARTLYSARYDNLDIDTILGSNRLVSNYVDCLLSRKPCPPEGKDLKRILPEALRTKCARCSPIQKENALKIITRLYFDYPDQYRALRERWDPSGEYHRRFEEYLRGLQFNQIGGSGGSGAGGAPALSGAGNGNTVESNGGNDRPVRNDLDRQPASQSSNVQPVVLVPTLSGGSANTLPATPPPPAPATERPRPPAPVAQILFPTPSATSDTRTATTTSATITTTTPATVSSLGTRSTATTTTTTNTTSTSNSGPVELTRGTAGVPAPSNTAPPTSTISITPSDGAGDVSSTDASPSDLASPTSPSTAAAAAAAEQDSIVVATPAPPLVVVNRFGDDAASVPTTTATTTTQRPTTTVRQTRPVTRQTTTRNTQRTTTRFITRVPQTPPPTPPRTTTTTTTTTTTLPPRPPPPQLPPAPQQQPLLPQAPPVPPAQAYPTTLYERPQAAPPRAPAPPQTFYVPDSPAAPPAPYGTTPDSIIDHFFVPPSQAANPPLPIVGLWNQLGTKIADTADAIAGMLQKTVDVLVTSHIQSHQRALRRT